MSILKSINFWVSNLIPQKIYWHLVGKIHPWEAVLENVDDIKNLYKQGEDLARMLTKLRLINRNSEVLDIGCGVGRLEYSLAKKVNRCVGVDIAPSMISLARNFVKDKNVTFLVNNGEDLKILNGQKFDLIYSIIVFQHLPQTIFLNYLRQSKFLLKKSGNIFFQIPIYVNDKPQDPPKNHPWAIRYYKMAKLREILANIGYKKIKFFNTSGGELTLKDNQAFVLAS